MRIIICIFILFAQSFTASAQSYVTKKNAPKKALKYYMKGKELNRANEAEKALKEFDKALREAPDFIDVYIEKAAIKITEGNDEGAEKELEKVIGIDPYYKSKLLYSLAFLEQKNGKCKEAKVHLEQYLKAPKTNETLVSKSKKLLADCEFELKAGAIKVDYDPILMPKSINTTNREYFPSISADGQTFYFTRVTKGQEDIYFCKKTETGWGEAQALSNINTPENEANQSISADGKTIIFTACNRRDQGFGSCDLYISQFRNGKWEEVKNMGAGINSSAWESQPSISADGKFLLFTSRRKNGKGKADIYYSKSNREGAWSVAKPIKGNINTSGDEQTPFLHPDGQTLYFKSDGHPGFGGQDIFFSKKQKDGTWGEPKNIGAPINTKANEGSFVVSLDGKTAYFDSDMELSENGAEKPSKNLHEIYYIELDEKLRPEPVTYVKAKVIDAETKKPLVANVDFMDLAIQKTHAYSTTDNSGEFLVCLPVGKDYGLNVSKPEYLFHSENFALKERDDNNEPYELIIELKRIPKEIAVLSEKPNTIQKPSTKPLTKPTPIILKNIFFATGSAVLKDESTGELLKLYQLLNETPKMKIQINGHTDNVGSDPDNLALSQKRAKSVYDYLIGKGIAASRLKHEGFGKNQPIDTNETKEGRQNNRRTEFIIIP